MCALWRSDQSVKRMRLRSLSRIPAAGIDAKDSEQIFEAFFTCKPTGMGMGLAICRSIIAAHNGRLWASPAPHVALVFYVVLPRDAGETNTVALK